MSVFSMTFRPLPVADILKNLTQYIGHTVAINGIFFADENYQRIVCLPKNGKFDGVCWNWVKEPIAPAKQNVIDIGGLDLRDKVEPVLPGMCGRALYNYDSIIVGELGQSLSGFGAQIVKLHWILVYDEPNPGCFSMADFKIVHMSSDIPKVNGEHVKIRMGK